MCIFSRVKHNLVEILKNSAEKTLKSSDFFYKITRCDLDLWPVKAFL